MPNFAPCDSGTDCWVACCNVPDPSKLACLPAGASRGEDDRGGRFYDTFDAYGVAVHAVTLTDLQRDELPTATSTKVGAFDPGSDRVDALASAVGGEHLGGV